MGPLEIALILANLPVVIGFVVYRSVPPWGVWLGGAALLLLAAQYRAIPLRWQMWPAYIVTTWAFLACLAPRFLHPGIVTGGFALVGLAGAAAAATVLPVWRFPQPTGQYPIGIVSLHLVDEARRETQGPKPDAPRELMISVWYPAASAGVPLTYRQASETSWRQSRLALVPTHAAADVPMATAPGRFPVILYAPSYAGGRDLNTFATEELASHGYVVVGIDHPYGSESVRMPDGRVIRTALDTWLDCSSDEAVAASIRRDNEQLALRVADVRFVLDQLAALDRHDPAGLMSGRLDLSRVGIFGHSFGGGVAAEACRADARFASGANLDGCLFGAAADEGVDKPFLFMNNDMPLPTEADIEQATGARRRYLAFLAADVRNIRRSLARYGGYYFVLAGANHANFADAPLTTPLRRRTEAGRIDPRRAMRVIDDYLLAFFDQTLKGQPQPLLDGAADGQSNNARRNDPEVTFQIWRAAAPESKVPASNAPHE